MGSVPAVLKSLALGLILVLTALVAPAAVAGQTATPAAVGDPTHAVNTFRNIPIHGATSTGGVFRGELDVTNFRNRDGQLYAVGFVSGRVRSAAGDLVGTINDQRVRLPLHLRGDSAAGNVTTTGAGACDILHLRLGPLDLDVLGLVIHLDRIRLDITAEPGPGNLLGNLLCAVTGLLDQTGVNNVLVNLLQAIRQILNGL